MLLLYDIAFVFIAVSVLYSIFRIFVLVHRNVEIFLRRLFGMQPAIKKHPA